MTTIPLGFEVGTGRAIEIPIAHMAVTGQTQQSGKTTTLEALVSRSGATALTFVTKRGEASFVGGRRIQPYFRDRADWQFVDQILEAQLHEKNKFLRPWIMKICRDTRTLAEVQERVQQALVSAKGINEGVYTQLDAYLELIVPEIENADLADTLDLQPGLNVMDVSEFATPMQMLFVQSAIDWVNERCRNTIVVVPEAWEFIPEGKGSPVKNSAVTLVRKGAALKNFIWIDSQDMAGVDKVILRGCTVWLMGVQREANEIDRNLKQIPAGMGRPKADAIAMLDKGQFFACHGRSLAKTYVWPSWASEDAARGVALGSVAVQSIIDQKPKEAEVSPEQAEALQRRNDELAAEVRRLNDKLAAASAARDEVDEAGAAPDPAVIEAAERRGYDRAAAEVAASAKTALEATLRCLKTAAEAMDGAITVVSQQIGVAGMRQLDAIATPAMHRMIEEGTAGRSPAAEPLRAVRALEDQIAQPAEPPALPKRDRAPRDPHAVPPGVDKLLGALARFPAKVLPRWEDVCLIAGMLHGNGYFYVAKKFIVEQELAIEDGEAVGITKEGADKTGGRGPKIMRAEVLQVWSGKVKPPGAAMLKAIAEKNGDWIDADTLGKKIGAKPGNGHWYGGVKAIRKPGLIEQDGNRFRLSEFMRSLPN